MDAGMLGGGVPYYDGAKEVETRNALGNKIKSISYHDQLVGQLNYHTEKVENLNKLIKLIEDNPNLEEFINLTREI